MILAVVVVSSKPMHRFSSHVYHDCTGTKFSTKFSTVAMSVASVESVESVRLIRLMQQTWRQYLGTKFSISGYMYRTKFSSKFSTIIESADSDLRSGDLEAFSGFSCRGAAQDQVLEECASKQRTKFVS